MWWVFDFIIWFARLSNMGAERTNCWMLDVKSVKMMEAEFIPRKKENKFLIAINLFQMYIHFVNQLYGERQAGSFDILKPLYVYNIVCR